MGWVSREEYCKREGISHQAYKKRKAKGLIQWRYGGSGRGGEAGKRIEVWVEDSATSDQSSVISSEKLGTRAVNRVAPACSMELVNGEPVIWPNGIKPEGTDETPMLPTPINGIPIIHSNGVEPGPDSEIEKRISESGQRIANIRFVVIQKFQEELARPEPNLPLFKNGNGHRNKTMILKRLLDRYNSGELFPEIYAELKSISRSTLYNWLQLYEQGGIDGLIPSYGKNKGFKKVTPAEQKFLRQFLLNQNKPKVADAIRKCKYILGDKSPSSPATLRRYVDWFKREYHDVWTLEREGQKAWNDMAAPYATRAWWTLQVGEILVADGHKLNFQVINPHTGKPCRATLIMFWDWHSSYPVGWEVMVTENIQCVATALRNAIIVLGKIPQHVYLDNGKAFKARCFTKSISLEESEIPGMFARLGINVIWAMKYNAQAKPIERIFGVLEWLEREVPSYTGASINDKPAALLPNEPRAKKLRGDFIPTLAQVNDLIRQWRDFYVQQPLRGRQNKTARELFDPGRGPGVDPKALCYLMMKAEVKGVRRGRLTFDGFDYSGDCLYGIKPQKVLVRYSLSDRSQMYVYDMYEQFLGVVTPVEATAPRDHEAANRIVSERRRLLRQTKTLANLAKAASPETFDQASRREPILLDFIEREEEKKSSARVLPFIRNEEITGKMSVPLKQETSSDPNERPVFYTDFERFQWILRQSFVDPKDQEWLDNIISNDSLYREAYQQMKGALL